MRDFILPDHDFGTPASKSKTMVTLTIDGARVTVPEGTSIMRAAGEAGIADRERFAAVVRAAFGKRRKTLRNALSGLCDEACFQAAGIDPGTRAEQVPVAGFVRLANARMVE